MSRRRGRDLTDPELRGRNLGLGFFDSGINAGGMTQQFAKPRPAPTPAPTDYTIDTDDEGDDLEPTMSATNRGTADPPPDLGGTTANLKNTEELYSQPFGNTENPLPTPAAGTTQPTDTLGEHTDNAHNPDHNNTDSHTTGMDMGQTIQNNEGSGLGNSEDRPTYEGKANMKGEIMTKVVDALSDVMSRYLLQGDNRRQLKNVNWDIGSVIPQVLGGDAKTAMDRIGFANAFMANPEAALTGAAMNYIKSGIDKIDGTNPFEEQSNMVNAGSQKMRDIKMYRGINSYITKSVDGDSLVEKAKHYLIAEANNATQKGGMNRMILDQSMSEEVQFIKHKAIMPYIVLACVFYVAYHKNNLDVAEYHGMFKSYVIERALKKILKDVLGLDKDVAAYAVDILEAVPQELINAFIRNIDNKQPIYDDERIVIDNFRDKIRKEFRMYFKTGYYDAVRKYQGQNIDLVGLMNGLSTSRVLHLFATQIITADNVVWEALNNQGLFLGLLELTAIHSRGTQDEGGGTADDFLEQMYAMGTIRYIPIANMPNRTENKVLDALKQMEREKPTETSKIYRKGNDIIVAMRGSDFSKRGKGDIVPPDYEANLENVAGSTDLYSTARYKEAQQKINRAIAEAKKTDGKVSVVGHSLGGRIALTLASHYHSIPFFIYEPVVSINAEMDKTFSNLKDANVKIFRVNNSAISQNLEFYKKKHNLKYTTIPQRRFSSHSIQNFI